MTENKQNPINKEVMDRLAKDTNSIHESLVINATKGKLKETIFKDYFLPGFLGLVEIPKDVNIMADWISISGGPTAEVDILDISGKVLYTVPPIFDTGAINPLVKKDKGLREVFAMFDLKMNNIPSAANKFLAVNLENELKTLTPNEQKKADHIRRWRDIILRYYPDLVKEEGSGFDTDVDISEDIEYD